MDIIPIIIAIIIIGVGIFNLCDPFSAKYAKWFYGLIWSDIKPNDKVAVWDKFIRRASGIIFVVAGSIILLSQLKLLFFK